MLNVVLYDKGHDFNFPMENFPFICSYIPATPAYGVYISQFIRYSRACGSYQDVLARGLLGSVYDKWNISIVICGTDIP
jgi:hypothetical protein